MGGVVSSGRNNDHLIDNLLEADYIKSPDIERVFRAVDRAEYFLPGARGNAYKDLAWKAGNLHLSAPCIYSEVMEGLNLTPGDSFLNLGSGTGYLSTMVGLIIGSRGINHGIELYEDVLEYAYKKLEDFKKYSGAIDEFDFCEPSFKRGNCLSFHNDGILYDKIYCGGACPEEYQNYVQNLLKIGGILVMPVNEHLRQIKRNSETDFECTTLLPVSFAPLVAPRENEDIVTIFNVTPNTLLEECRIKIRHILRRNVEKENPPASKPATSKGGPKRKRCLRKLVVPIFESDDSSEEDHRRRVQPRYNCGQRNRQPGRAMFRDSGEFFSVFLESAEVRNLLGFGPPSADPTRINQVGSRTVNNAENEEESNPPRCNRRYCEEAIPENDVENENYEENIENFPPEEEPNGLNKTENLQMDVDTNESQESSNHNRTEVEVEVHLNNEVPANPPQCNDSSRYRNNFYIEERTKRDKISNGIGENIIEYSSTSDEEEEEEFAQNEGPDSTTTTESDREEDANTSDDGMRMYISPYTVHVKSKLEQLPLPPILKSYLNYYRDF